MLDNLRTIGIKRISWVCSKISTKNPSPNIKINGEKSQCFPYNIENSNDVCSNTVFKTGLCYCWSDKGRSGHIRHEKRRNKCPFFV